MRSLTGFGAVALVTIASASGATEPRPATSISGVAIGASADEVKAALGVPTDIRDTGDALDPEWHFGTKVVVSFWDRGERVAEVRASDPASCTDTGVCPGMTMRAVHALIGDPVGGAKLSEGSNQYATTYETCWLDVSIHNNRVQSLAIKCQP